VADHGIPRQRGPGVGARREREVRSLAGEIGAVIRSDEYRRHRSREEARAAVDRVSRDRAFLFLVEIDLNGRLRNPLAVGKSPDRKVALVLRRNAWTPPRERSRHL